MNKTMIYALGGLEEIGKNTYAVETNNSLIIIDAGIKFTNSSYLGFDALVANYEYIKSKEDKLEALVITHGHEDHIGGIPYLLKTVKVKKIIASKLTAQLILKKVSDFKGLTCPEIIVYEDDSTFDLNEISLEFFRVCHSIPDSFGVAIKTKDGTIVETGDFRFDFATNADNTDLSRLMAISNKKVDVLLCESTSAEVPGFSESEKYIIKNIEEFIRKAPGRIFLSTFASNLSRIEEVLKIIKSLNRKILILGRSMETNIKISRKIGYLKMTDPDFITSKDLVNYADNEVFVILTGSQGEESAALNAICNGKHPKISFKANDTVILSSNPIPGNFAQVEKLVNKLYKQGVTVIENKPEKKIHASGHATRSELQLMIKAINPKYLVPIHGEYKMLATLRQNAKDLGFTDDHIMIGVNGQILELKDHHLTLTDQFVDASPMFVNNGELNADANKLLELRKSLSIEGFILVSVKFSQSRKQVFSISITPRGSFFARESTALINKIISEIKSQITTYWNNESNFSFEQSEKLIEKIVSDYVWRIKKKKPNIFIEFIDIESIKRLLIDVPFIKQDVQFIEEEINSDDAFNELAE